MNFRQQENPFDQNRSPPPSNAMPISSCSERVNVMKSPFLFKKPMTPTPSKLIPSKMTPNKIEKNSCVQQSSSKLPFNPSKECRLSYSPFKKGQSNISEESRSRNKGFMRENDLDNIFNKSPEYPRNFVKLIILFLEIAFKEYVCSP